jgi:hypothetical protein
MHSQRYFIKRSFQELKQQLGLNEYQVRGYGGWHRHMFMCMMGLLFIQTEKMVYFKINEVPSTPQLAELMKILLPQKIRTMADVLAEFKKLKIPIYYIRIHGLRKVKGMRTVILFFLERGWRPVLIWMRVYTSSTMSGLPG